MEREALKLALEALENSVDLVVEDAYNAEQLYGNYPTRQGKVGGLKVLAEQHKQAITAIKEALAQPAPVQEFGLTRERFNALEAEITTLQSDWLFALKEVVRLKAAQPAQEPWRESASDYERGVIDGRQKQAQSSVDKAVNRMAQRTEERNFCPRCGKRTPDLETIHTCTPPQETALEKI